MPDRKNPPLHFSWIAAGVDGSASAEIHRAYTRLAWRGEIDSAPPRGTLLLRSVEWPFRAFALALHQAIRRGTVIARRTGKSRLAQLWEMLHLSLRHSIPPRAYYMFSLYEPENYTRAPRYLYRYETKRALYRHLNRHLGGDPRVVDDKVFFAERCRAGGVPTPEVFVEARAGELHWLDPARAALPRRSLILKPGGGKGGKGIERWDYREGRYFDHEEGSLTVDELEARLRRLSLDRDYLVQPLLSNHPELEELSRGALSTVRVMTARNERGEHEVLSATVRIAVGNRVVDNFHRGGVGSAVNLATGELGPAIGIDVATDWLEIHPLTGTRIRGRALPGWAGVLEAALRAHDAMPGLVFAGWDVAMTPTGPTVIEGNSEPCVNFLQRSHGGPLGDTRFGELFAHHLRAIDAARVSVPNSRPPVRFRAGLPPSPAVAVRSRGVKDLADF
jgi:glutathione synthase/RimK-type ligase-like ATP-grasp enzyme